MSVLSIITCTGQRPEAFKLCQEYMKRQTYKGQIQWIVIDDSHLPGTRPIVVNVAGWEFHSGPVQWKEGLNTQRFNMEKALKLVRGDKLLIMEDDEFYRPDYIEKMSQLLDYASVVGEGNAKYYHLQIPGWKEMRNSSHASLCQTGLRRESYPLLQKAVDSGEMYFDIHLWRAVHEKRVPCLVFQDLNLCIGIKGMPGRHGIGAGHKTRDYLYDSNLNKLREWLGADADNYLPFIKRKNNDVQRNQRSVLQPRQPGKAVG